MTGATSLDQLLDNPKIPTPPAIALQVLERVGHPECSLAEIREIIRHDPALCGLILKTLNSVLYSFSHAVTSIEQALVLLGLSRVRSLVLTLYLPAIRNVARASPHLRNFWKSSVIGAIVARELAFRVGRSDPESDLLAGLMRDMGKVVMSQLHPLEYSDLLQHAESVPETELCDRETRQFGLNHAGVSAALLQRWRLPELIVKAVAYHHHPEQTSSYGREVGERAHLLHFASLASQFLTSPQVPGLKRELLQRSFSVYGMDEPRLAEFLSPLSTKVQELGALLNVEVGRDLNYASVLSSVSEELVKLTLQTSIDSVREQQTARQVEREADQWKKAAHRLKEQTLRDPLTGLHNRAYLYETLTLELRRLRRRFAMLGLMFIDLDGFKPINDKYGHAFGDQVLKEVSSVMLSSIRSVDTAARFGGDEFCVLLPEAPEAAYKLIGERLIRSINKMELRFGRHLCSVGASVGIAYCLPFSGNGDADQLMEAADKAMYSSKNGGKNRVSLVSLLSEKDREMKEAVERRSFRAFLVRRGLVTEQQILQAHGNRLTRMCLQRIARKLNWLTKEEARELSRLQRVSRRPFADLAIEHGYLKQPDAWVLLAIQQDNPESLSKRIVGAGLLGAHEMTEELEAYYLMIGSRAGSNHGSQAASGSRSGFSAKTVGGSHAGFLARASGSRYGSILNHHKER